MPSIVLVPISFIAGIGSAWLGLNAYVLWSVFKAVDDFNEGIDEHNQRIKDRAARA